MVLLLPPFRCSSTFLVALFEPSFFVVLVAWIMNKLMVKRFDVLVRFNVLVFTAVLLLYDVLEIVRFVVVQILIEP